MSNLDIIQEAFIGTNQTSYAPSADPSHVCMLSNGLYDVDIFHFETGYAVSRFGDWNLYRKNMEFAEALDYAAQLLTA